MARVTIEDCLAHVENRFELVLLASRRARQLISGKSEPFVPWNLDKPTVVALREIAQNSINKAVMDGIDARHQQEAVAAAVTAVHVPEVAHSAGEEATEAK